MKLALVMLLCACALCAVQCRDLQQASYKSVADALSDPKNSGLSTLLAAVKAAGLSVPADKAWTIFAPTNEAFAKADVKAKTGVTAAQLLEPANKKALTEVLQYHIVPSAAVKAAQLKDGQKLTTALASAAPLTVNKAGGKVDIKAGKSTARVMTADVGAGKAIIHIIDNVLLPGSAPAASG